MTSPLEKWDPRKRNFQCANDQLAADGICGEKLWSIRGLQLMGRCDGEGRNASRVALIETKRGLEQAFSLFDKNSRVQSQLGFP